MQAHWRVQAADPGRAQRLGAALGLHPITAQLLMNRGVTSEAAASRFLSPTLRTLGDPFVLPDMERAIVRLRRAIRRREPIVIFSDSDVDGLTASVILYEALRHGGAQVRAIQSNRIDDGYGLPKTVVERIASSDAKLVMLVDCGTNQPEAVQRLIQAGIDTIIVDHHIPLEAWAKPVALVNPHRADGDGTGREFCSAGLAFKIAQALLDGPAIGPRPLAMGPSRVLQRMGGRDVAPRGAGVQGPRALPVGLHPASGPRPSAAGRTVEQGLSGGRDVAPRGAGVQGPRALPVGLHDAEGRLEAWLDLAALGTLADCSRLVGDNRVLVAEGAARIVRSHRPGLSRLCEATGTTNPNADHIVKQLIPRLNASGRLGDARAIWQLLTEEPEGALETWLSAAEAAHGTTKQLHRRILAEAQEQVNRMHFGDAYVMVVSHRSWHQGLMGPVASQLANRYGRPAIALAIGEQYGIGSGRSIPMFNLLDALRACEGALVRFGGHAQACGLTVDGDRLEEFRALVNAQARRVLGPEGLVPTQLIDAELPLEAVTPDWVEEVPRLAPFGFGNPKPTVMIRNVTLEIVSPRVARLSRDRVTLAAKGSFATLVSGGGYDVVGSPTTLAGELVLAVSDAKVSTGPSAPVPTSGTTCRRAPA